MVTATTTRPQRVLLWLAPALITIAMVGFAAGAASDPRAPAPIWILGVIAIAVGWWSYVSIPRRIAVDGSDLRLDRPLGSITVPIAEIRKVDARGWNRGFVIVRRAPQDLYASEHQESLCRRQRDQAAESVSNGRWERTTCRLTNRWSGPARTDGGEPTAPAPAAQRRAVRRMNWMLANDVDPAGSKR